MLGEWYLPPGECQVILPIKKVPFPFPTTLSSPFRQGSLKPRFCKQITRTPRNPPGPRIRRSEALPRHQEVSENGGLVGSGLDREPLGKAFGISAHRYCFAIHGQRDPASLARNLDSMPEEHQQDDKTEQNGRCQGCVDQYLTEPVQPDPHLRGPSTCMTAVHFTTDRFVRRDTPGQAASAETTQYREGPSQCRR